MVYSELNEPWVAVDVGWYESGRVVCGDWLLVVFEDGPPLLARAWDAGRFKGRWVEDYGSSVPILADLPAHLRPDDKMAWPVRMLNLSERLSRWVL